MTFWPLSFSWTAKRPSLKDLQEWSLLWIVFPVTIILSAVLKCIFALHSMGKLLFGPVCFSSAVPPVATERNGAPLYCQSVIQFLQCIKCTEISNCSIFWFVKNKIYSHYTHLTKLSGRRERITLSATKAAGRWATEEEDKTSRQR